MKLEAPFWSHTESVAAGGSSVIVMPCKHAFALVLTPGASGGAVAEFTASSTSEISAGTARWRPFLSTSGGAAVDKSSQTPVRALRISATAAACVVDLVA